MNNRDLPDPRQVYTPSTRHSRLRPGQYRYQHAGRGANELDAAHVLAALSNPGSYLPLPTNPGVAPAGPGENANHLLGHPSREDHHFFPPTPHPSYAGPFPTPNVHHRDPLTQGSTSHRPLQFNTPQRGASIQSPPSTGPRPNTQTTRPLAPRKRETITVQFADVAAHTAKCDECDKRNKDGMSRCLACGWQCCRKCLGARGGDRTHEGFSATHAPDSERQAPAPRPTPNATINNPPQSPEENAGRALVRMASLTPSTERGRNNTMPGGGQTGARNGDLRGVVDGSGSDDETLTWVSEELEEEDEEPGVDIPEAVLREIESIRRNPPRASRPRDLAE